MTNYLTSVGVQHFSITIASSSQTGTATITAVGSGAFILLNGNNPATNGNPSLDFCTVLKTNSTTITATKNGATTGTVTINGCIIDADTTNFVKSVQSGTLSISSGTGTGTATTTAVTDANTAVHSLGFTCAETTANTNKIYARLTQSGTTTTGTVGTTGDASVQAYQLIEFQAGALTANAVQRVAATISTSVTSWTATLTSLTTTASLSIFGGYTTASTVLTMAVVMFRGSLTNGTTFTVNTNTAEAVAKTFNASIAEFANGVLNSSIQRGTTTLTGATSNTTTITSVVKGNSCLSGLCNTSTDTGFDYIQALGAAALTSNTVVTVTKNTATANITHSWEVVEFPAFTSVTVLNWFPVYAPEVNPYLPAAQFSRLAMPVVPQVRTIPGTGGSISEFSISDQPISGSPNAAGLFVNWVATFDNTVNPFKSAAQYSFVAQKLQPSPIAQTNWYPNYDAQVEPYFKAAQYSTYGELLASPITINRFYPVYDPRVIPGALAARFSTPLAQLLPTPITILNWLPDYSAEVKASPLSAKFSIFTQKALSSIGQTDWYPVYDPDVNPNPLNARNTYFAEILPAPVTLNNWYPSYQATVPAWPLAAKYSQFAQTLSGPASIINWLPVYKSEVSQNTNTLQQFTTQFIPVISTPVSTSFICFNDPNDLFNIFM